MTQPTGGADTTRLLQPLWDLMRDRADLVTSPLAPALGALLLHLLLCAPFLALDALGDACPRVRLYRIPKTPKPRVLRQWGEALRRITVNYAVGVLPCTAALQYLRRPALPDLAPGCWQLCVEVALCLFLFDALFFLLHYVMHRPSIAISLHPGPYGRTGMLSSPLENNEP
ncbi:Cholesterol 25-hydroxylase [Merluccius polli]|uniref:Cholesterol 25-hydroxylase n=1 Tax=Merluccius polli TaxID=89951 RepID=A0AA47N288_MERPO|nr:Cholesterol 25-hydroxylase [Merluccius polli]